MKSTIIFVFLILLIAGTYGKRIKTSSRKGNPPLVIAAIMSLIGKNVPDGVAKAVMSKAADSGLKKLMDEALANFNKVTGNRIINTLTKKTWNELVSNKGKEIGENVYKKWQANSQEKSESDNNLLLQALLRSRDLIIDPTIALSSAIKTTADHKIWKQLVAKGQDAKKKVTDSLHELVSEPKATFLKGTNKLLSSESYAETSSDGKEPLRITDVVI